MRSSGLALLAIVAIAMIVGGASYIVIQNNRNNLIRAYEMRIDLGSAQALIVDQETGIRGYTSTHERMFVQPYIDGQPRFEDTLQQLRRDAQAEASLRAGSLARRHGGRIEVKSALNVGSTFTLILPCQRSAMAASLRVQLISRDDELSPFIVHLLRSEGYKIR